MSIVLMGSTGLVLDSGRLYSRHTAMQAFADAMALAAATELDSKADSITRARAAIDGLSGDPYLSKLDSQGNEFRVSRIVFYKALNASTGTSLEFLTLSDSKENVIPVADESDPNEQAAARYVAVEAEQIRIGLLVGPISQIVSPSGTVWESQFPEDGPNIPSTADVQTVAVATLVQETCADLSTLVLCNPWEDELVDTYETQTIPGRTIRYFAPNFERASIDPQEVTPSLATSTIGSLFDYDVRNQLHLLFQPVSDPAGVCGLDLVLGYTRSGDDGIDLVDPDYLEARDRCLLARARSERVCFGTEVGIRPAPGPLVLEGLNVAFDFWLPPLDALITPGVGDVTVQNTGNMPLAAFFEPDVNVLNRWQLVGDVVPGYDYVPARTDYEVVPAPGYTNRPIFNERHDACHISDYEFETTGTEPAGEPVCSLRFVSDDTTLTASERSNYLNGTFERPRRPTAQNPGPTIPTTVETWYDLYKHERATGMVNQYVQRYSSNALVNPSVREGLSFDYNDFLSSIGGTRFHTGHERRKVRSAMVNCRAMYNGVPQTSGGVTYYNTPILAILDIHLSEPATMFCGDADGSGTIEPSDMDCSPADSIETSIILELVQDSTDQAYDDQSYAVLVR